MRVSLILAALTALIGIATPGFSGSQAAESPALAEINGKKITLEYFNKRYEENKKFFPVQAPSRKAVLDDMIKREVGIQEAKKLKIDSDPVVIERMETVLYHGLLEKVLSKELEKITPGEDELRTWYNKNPEIRTSHIFLGLSPQAPEADVSKAMERMKQIQGILRSSKKSFSEIAQEYSEGVAAPTGGDIDYQSKDRLDPSYYRAALKIGKPGGISDIVRSQYGLHIIKLTAIRPWLETDKAKVRRQVFEEKRQVAFDRYMDDLVKKSKVTVRSDLL
jgi:peptidyl-prolyl cis-trans isomerase C/peptidyl-prolyl cis-trans isomerase D